MNEIILKLIIIIHTILVLFIIIVPFTNSNYLLFLHAIICPFIMLHWLLSDNTCALTLMEKFVRQKINGNIEPLKDEDCFTCRIIDPVYKFTENYADHSTVAYISVTILWLISVCKLYYKFNNGEISSIFDLAKI